MIPKEIRNVSFPGAVRGYDRDAVDDYVKSVNQVIAELEISSSPRAAVRHALEQVGEQTTSILQRAREAAEEITASARQESDEILERARAEAAEIVVNASTTAERERAESAAGVAAAKAEADEILAESKAEAEKALAQARADAAQRLQRSQQELAALRDEAESRMRELHADTDAVREARGELLNDVRGLAVQLEELASAAAGRHLSEASDEAEPAPDAEPTEEMSAVGARDPGDQEPPASARSRRSARPS